MSPKGLSLVGIGVLSAIGAEGRGFAASDDCRRESCAAQVAAGSGFTCAVTPSGAAECWGLGSVGQLGNGASGAGVQSDLPQPVVSLGSGVAQVTAGFSHACALKRDGTLWCWGNGFAGELGDGQQGPGHQSAVPVQVAALGREGVQVSAGNSFTCAVKRDRTAWCWGENLQGQIGQGFLSTGLQTGIATPSRVIGLSQVAEVAAGGFHACARVVGGAVFCWGNDQLGELGDGVTGVFNPTPVAAQGLSGVVALDAGQEHTCAVEADGSLWCWGNNPSGELGIGETGGSRAVPTQVVDLSDAQAVDAGFEHTCAVAGPERALFCWGTLQTSFIYNTLGAFPVQSDVPLRVGGDLEARVSRASVGKAHTCAIREESLLCWGANPFGELGLGDEQDHLAPTRVDALCRERGRPR